jgi:hypothetical protein
LNRRSEAQQAPRPSERARYPVGLGGWAGWPSGLRAACGPRPEGDNLQSLPPNCLQAPQAPGSKVAARRAVSQLEGRYRQIPAQNKRADVGYGAFQYGQCSQPPATSSQQPAVQMASDLALERTIASCASSASSASFADADGMAEYSLLLDGPKSPYGHALTKS